VGIHVRLDSVFLCLSFHSGFDYASPGYIAGVTNLIFESSRSWDLLCDVGTGRMVVSKDIHTNFPLTPSSGPWGQPLTRSGTLRAEPSIGSEDDFGRSREKPEFVARADNYDNIFMEDVGFF
jgi:Stabilization of polarity axis